jgi:DnaJ-class molecular chaperone
MKKEICLECDGNGYVADSDGEQRVYRDCDRCDSEGEIAVAQADPSV